MSSALQRIARDAAASVGTVAVIAPSSAGTSCAPLPAAVYPVVKTNVCRINARVNLTGVTVTNCTWGTQNASPHFSAS